MYHSDCQTNFCLRLDTEERISVEGVCGNNLKMPNGCSLTIANIDKRRAALDGAVSLNRCEFVPCMFDAECSDGLYCHMGRFCYGNALKQKTCNTTEIFSYRNSTDHHTEEDISNNRCFNVQCSSNDDCSAAAPYCVRFQCKDTQPIFSPPVIITFTGAFFLLFGLLVGITCTRYRQKKAL